MVKARGFTDRGPQWQ